MTCCEVPDFRGLLAPHCHKGQLRTELREMVDARYASGVRAAFTEPHQSKWSGVTHVKVTDDLAQLVGAVAAHVRKHVDRHLQPSHTFV